VSSERTIESSTSQVPSLFVDQSKVKDYTPLSYSTE